MKKFILFLFIAVCFGSNAQNNCTNPFSLCTNFSYSASINTSSLAGPDYACLSTQPNPTWFYTQVTSSGALQFDLSSTQNSDIDFICWGPFLSMNSACTQLTAAKVVDCSYSASATETVHISGGITGQYYMIMVTNYANVPNVINFQNIPSTGSACAYDEGISGKVYNDLNTNCLYDTTDIFTKNIPVKQYDTLGNFLGMSYQNTYGSSRMPYKFHNDTGAYVLKIDTTNMPFVAQCMYPGLDSLVTLTTAMPLDTNINFSIKCKPGFDISAHSINRSGWVFPGLNHKVKIIASDVTQQFYNLSCATNVGGQVVVNFSGPVSYLSTLSTIQPSSVSGNSITYTIADFSTVNIYDDFLISLTTHTNATIGDSVCVDVVATAAGDNNLTNNQKHYCYNVVNSYDPNMKETYPENVLPGYNDWFYYTIHFQNTGSAPAHNIALTDTLSDYLDVSTFERINYSHDNSTLLFGKLLQFNFNNINLPDSNTNSLGSQGFVQYRIKPKSNLAAGTVIDNTAYIYFDYNAPVVTNTSHNNYLLITNVKDLKNKEFTLYPNPTTGMITIAPKAASALMNVLVYNIVGDIVFDNKTIEGKTTLDLSYLDNGVYFVKVNSATYKLVIQK